MSIFGSLGAFFSKLGKTIASALDAAGAHGLTDEVVALALQWAKVAANQALDNGQKREFVVQLLIHKGVPESIARLATELAVQALKKEVAKV